MKQFLLSFLLLLSISVNSQAYEWVKTFGPKEGFLENPDNLGTDTSGNVYVTLKHGNPSSGQISGVSYNLLLKYAPGGSLLWVDTIGQGYLKSAIDGNGNTFLISAATIKKIDNNGQLLWTKVTGNYSFNQIKSTVSGKIVVAGFTGSGTCDTSVFAMYDTNGTELWLRKGDSYGCDNSPFTCDKNEVTYALREQFVNQQYVLKLLVIDSTGNLVTAPVLSQHTQPVGYYLLDVDDNATVYLTKTVYDFTYVAKTTFQKMDLQGNQIWSTLITHKTYGKLSVMFHDNDNNIYLGGTVWDHMKFQNTVLTASLSMVLLKVHQNGFLLSAKQTTGSYKTVYPYCAKMDKHQNIFLAGVIAATHQFDTITVTGNDPYSDLFVAKLNQNTAVGLHEYKMKDDLAVYPNPSTGMINLEYHSNEALDAEVNILTVLGEKVYENKMNLGVGIKSLNLNGFSKGVYFLKINSGPHQFIKKLILE
ncbi:MAG: hypothetical protein K0S32_2445 [Bacteroidetes bacterium]|jgi:hypothetical protein|nr:hypothetical protein [Bacteroidota bacterium]